MARASRRARPRPTSPLTTSPHPPPRRAEQATTRPDQAGGPRRTCIGCRRVGTPDTLMRVAVGPNGGIVAGRGAPGRGAWLCAGSIECFDRAVRRRGFSRALRNEVRSEALAEVRRELFDRTEET